MSSPRPAPRPRPQLPPTSPPAALPADAERTLRLVGLLLIAIAIVNIGLSLALPPAGRSAAPGIVVDLVGAGLGLWLLHRPRLVAAHVAAWYAAFGIGFGIAVFAVLLPVLKPLAVWAEALRADFVIDGIPLLRGLAHLALLAVVDWLLRSAPLRQANAEVGRVRSRRWLPLVLGAGLPCVLALAIALGR